MSIPPPTPLQFSPLSSSINPSFWHALTTLKLQVLKLSDEPVPIWASYARGRTVVDRATGERVGMGAVVELGGEGVESPAPESNGEKVILRGILRNFNTIEEFRNADKTKLMDNLADQIYASATDATAATGTLNPFLMITFADLKKYKYYYWCCFPALLVKGWQVDGEWSLMTQFSADHTDGLREAVSNSKDGYALVKPSERGFDFAPLTEFASFYEGVKDEDRTLAFLDASTHPTAPAWPLRNVLTRLALAHNATSLRLIAFRDSPDSTSALTASLTAHISLDPADLPVQGQRPGVVGWEKNDKLKLGPRAADLAPLMDPARLADQAVDLNLQLMRWRIMPELDLDKVKQTKVLLLGAGTLGCYVARTVMAWGVRKITLVDSGTVSFSNPVRQPLFEFEDSLGGGKPKAEAAAASLKRIYPGVDATGVTLSIPMPGHPIPPANVEKAKADVAALEKLIEEHDVVYLLMDSRESRWLPTVIGAAKRKLVMDVALGFDTFLVMRHGVPPAAGEPAPPPVSVKAGEPYTGRLGCYYCNDIVAPMDSLTDRTLDQMCTVTRPGIASIASSTAVELMVSILQHPKGSLAPSDVPLPSSTSSSHTMSAPASVPAAAGSPLGLVPHQLRGFLSQFSQLRITGQAYALCTGCSPAVVGAYEREGWAMLAQAFEEAKFLERLTGLDEMVREGERAMEAMLEGEGESGEDDF